MPTVYSIPPSVSFVSALAGGLLARAGGDPLALARMTVLLPTRRACRALQEAFLRVADGRALLLPRLVPLGDVDAEELVLTEDTAATFGPAAAQVPPSIAPLTRRLLLGQLIRTWGEARGAAPSEDQAVRLAAELARLLDQVETEGLSFDRLTDLVPEDYAAHWQSTLAFLRILTDEWPRVQAALGVLGPAERRRRLLEAQAEAWRRDPPHDPVIAAGSTGSIPATAALLRVIADLPQGMVVLPGLDQESNAATWSAIREDPVHPQHGLAQLLDRLEIDRAQVKDWPDSAPSAASALRGRFVAQALAPAQAVAQWPSFVDETARESLESALSAVHRVDCPGSGEEAAVIALILRHALTEPGRRAALVTPDRDLARRVAAALHRWGLQVDDSAGVPLTATPPGTFLRLTAAMMAEDLAPVPLLAALKHPLAAGGRAPSAFRAKVRALEVAVLRGPRPEPGFEGLRKALKATPAAASLLPWLADLERLAAPLVAAQAAPAPLPQLLDAHIAFAEALARSDSESGAARLWAGEAGTAAADFIADLRAAASGNGAAMPAARYPALLLALMAGQVVRPRYGSHPRVSIWGPLEARLQHVDVLVLGGLNEGTWPAESDLGPWLSRPMRRDFGLPSVERRIGQAAHDFVQAFGAPNVYLTRASRVGGAPTVPSRWLLRMEALLHAAGLAGRLSDNDETNRWPAWAEALDRPRRYEPETPPAPAPPLAARPRRLSVTRIETWMRDPYALYAREVLSLRALPALDADPGAAEFGTLIHAALETFLKRYPDRLPDDVRAALIEIGRTAFEQAAAPPGVWAFWWPRFERIAAWLGTPEAERRAGATRVVSEGRGRLALDAPGGAFTLTAIADRIDIRRDGTLAILDYKTGAPPSDAEVRRGLAPQLPLEAAIARAGGFEGVPAAPVADLAYWRLSGGRRAGEIRSVKEDATALADQAIAALARLVARFDDASVPYPARPRPDRALRFNDYAHLAREKAWISGEAEDDNA